MGPMHETRATRPPIRRSRAGGARKQPVCYGDPQASSPTLRAAQRGHRKGQLAEAAALYRAVLDQDPTCLDARVNLGSLHARAGAASAARALFVEVLASVTDPRALRDVAFGLLHIGALPQARTAFERALEGNASLIGARLGLARLCGELGDHEAAVHHARRAVHDAPEEASAHLELHRALFDDRALDPCIEAAARAVSLDPGYALARYLLAGALARSGCVDEARQALGSEGLIEAGLVDALWYALRPGLRCFSTKRATLLFALELAPSQGPVIDLGVRHGVSTRLLAEASGAEVHGFDSFQGLPESWQSRPAGAFSTAGELPPVPPSVRLYPGLFAETLPPFAATLREPPRLIHVDCDLYSSAAEAFSCLGPLVRPGCVIVLDEYIGNASFREDEHRALHEAAARLGWRIDERCLNWITGQGVVLVG
jgi:thioredoxin-like negative regulator of GroEL